MNNNSRGLDLMGGRKFLMAIMLTIAGIVIEVYGKNGLSTNMAGLLAAMYATFSASNAIITSKQLSSASAPEAKEEAALANPAEEALSKNEAKQVFGAVDQGFQKLQSDILTQAQQISVLQKAFLDKQRHL